MSDSYALRTRVPGQSGMSEIVRSQRHSPARSPLKRAFGVSPLARGSRRAYREALGDLLVGDALDHLGPEWDVLHAVPIGAELPDIDHVIIGPPGVFTVTTRNHSGAEVWVNGQTLLVGGRRQHHVREALFEAERAESLLSAAAGRSVAVNAVIVVVKPQKLTVRDQPAGATVVSSRQLVRHLARLPRSLSGTEVAHISDLADRCTTWHASSDVAADTQQLHRDFSLLRNEVRSATRRRIWWLSAGVLGIVGSAWLATAVAVGLVMR